IIKDYAIVQQVKDTLLTPSSVITGPLASNVDVEAVMVNQAIVAKTIRLNPRAKSFVQDYMVKHTKDLNDMKGWGKPYFNTMENILVQYGLPTELKYLAVIESKLNSSAVSWAGAVGPWQFMPATARGYGLKVTKFKDERKDYRKSTEAAAKYLKYLYGEFGDWLLVIAAYNGGPGYVYNAIKKSKSRNFWDLQYYLPAESRDHVKKFISTHYIFEGQGGITTLTRSEATEQIGALAGYLFNRKLTGEELDNSKTTTISGKYHSAVIAKYINMDIEDFNRYNPEFDKMIAGPDSKYELKLPGGKMETFIANKYPILNESVELLLNDINISANIETTHKMKDQTTLAVEAQTTASK
ncbi:MAG: lytic transglycosylase domain-containing protein, partial [Flavitalea sp.]